MKQKYDEQQSLKLSSDNAKSQNNHNLSSIIQNMKKVQLSQQFISNRDAQQKQKSSKDNQLHQKRIEEQANKQKIAFAGQKIQSQEGSRQPSQLRSYQKCTEDQQKLQYTKQLNTLSNKTLPLISTNSLPEVKAFPKQQTKLNFISEHGSENVNKQSIYTLRNHQHINHQHINNQHINSQHINSQNLNNKKTFEKEKGISPKPFVNKIERIPFFRKVIEYEDKVMKVPVEKVYTDYYEVEHITEYLPKQIMQTVYESIAQQKVMYKLQYVPVEKKIIHVTEKTMNLIDHQTRNRQDQRNIYTFNPLIEGNSKQEHILYTFGGEKRAFNASSNFTFQNRQSLRSHSQLNSHVLGVQMVDSIRQDQNVTPSISNHNIYNGSFNHSFQRKLIQDNINSKRSFENKPRSMQKLIRYQTHHVTMDHYHPEHRRQEYQEMARVMAKIVEKEKNKLQSQENVKLIYEYSQDNLKMKKINNKSSKSSSNLTQKISSNSSIKKIKINLGLDNSKDFAEIQNQA